MAGKYFALETGLKYLIERNDKIVFYGIIYKTMSLFHDFYVTNFRRAASSSKRNGYLLLFS